MRMETLSRLGLDFLFLETKSCICPALPQLPAWSHVDTENSLCLFIPNFVCTYKTRLETQA